MRNLVKKIKIEEDRHSNEKKEDTVTLEQKSKSPKDILFKLNQDDLQN
jgi:hypothetical protein